MCWKSSRKMAGCWAARAPIADDLLAYLEGEHGAPIAGLAAMRHIPLFASADASGAITIWSSRGALTPYNPMLRLSHWEALRELVPAEEEREGEGGAAGGGEAQRDRGGGERICKFVCAKWERVLDAKCHESTGCVAAQ